MMDHSSPFAACSLGRAAPWGLAFAALLVMFAAACSDPQPQRPKHVLLIVVDTLRADHLSVFGYPRPTSPNIDRLAREGVLFKRAIAQASFTSPSMVSLMTGRYVAKERGTIPAELTTLAECFQRAGWATGGFASNPLITPANGFARGFERFEVLDEYGSNDPIARFLAEHRGRRTFTYVHITEPHDPYLSPEGQRQWREAASYLPGDRADFYSQLRTRLGLASSPQEIQRIQQEIGGYDDDVRYADGRVAAVLTLYEQLGLRDKLAVALTSDHGEGLWQHIALMNGQRGAKLRAGEQPGLMNTLMPTHGNQVHQSLVHVPLVLSGVGLPRGKPFNDPVENIDLFPTLLDLADVPTPGGLQGRSLIARLSAAPNADSFAFSFTRFNVTVVDAQGWALILPTPEGECAEELALELFYLPEDPHQRVDRSADKPQIVERLRKVAEQRMAAGIQEGDVPSEATLQAFAQLGYGDQVAHANARLTFEASSSDELLARLMSLSTPCTDRLLAAEVLTARKLDDAAREQLESWRRMESSNAVKTVLERALSR